MLKLREQSFRKKSSFKNISKNLAVLFLILILMFYLKG